MADGSVRIVVDTQQAQKQVVDLNRALGNTRKSVNNLQKALEVAATKLSQLGQSSTAASTGTGQLNRAIAESHRNYQRSQLAIAQLNAQLQLMQNQMMGMQASITQLQQSHIQATQSANTQAAATGELSNTMQRTTRVAFSLHSILLQLGVVYGLQQSIQVLKEFDHAMAQVEAISGATGSALDDLRERAKELGATTIYTSGEAGQAMKFLAQSGFDVNEILAASGPVLALAQAGDLGLAQAAEIAAKALRGFRLEATQMSDVADVMAAAVTQSTMNITELGYAFKYVAPIAASLGVDIRETSAYIGVLSDAGIDATMAGTALRRVMSELSGPTFKATRLLAAHGLTMADVDIRVRGLTAVMRTMEEAGLSVGEAFAMFGQRGAPAFQTLVEQMDRVEKKTADLQNITGRAMEMQRIMNQSLFAAFKNLTSAIEFFIIEATESTGLLNGMKVTLFGTAEGVRFLARNMEVVAPIVVALASTKIPALVAAIGRIGVVAAATTSLKKLFDVSTLAQNATTAVRSLSAQFAAARAAGTLAGAAMQTAMVGVNAAVGATVGGVKMLVSALGGPLNIALALAGGALMYFTMHQTEAEKAGERLEDLLAAQARGAEEYAEALNKMRESLKSLDLVHSTKKYEQEKEALKGLREELIRAGESIYDMGNTLKVSFAGENGLAFEKIAIQVRGYTSSLKNGEMSIDQYIDSLNTLLAQTNDNQSATRELITQQIDVAVKTKVSADAADLYAARMAVLTGNTERCTEAQKKLEEQLKIVQLLRREAVDELMADTFDDVTLARIYEEGSHMKAEQFKVFFEASKIIKDKLGPEVLRFYTVSEDGLGLVRRSVEELKKMGIESTERIEFIPEADLKHIRERLVAQKKLRDLQRERREMDEAEREATRKKGGGTGGLKEQAKALSKVNEELARMTMTDREFQQFKFEEELAKLVKTVGLANPQVQELIKLWEKAKELGLSSPKELINARTSFEDFVATKQHGNDPGWKKKAQIDAQAEMLRQMYQDDAEKRVYIEQWVADQKNQINERGLQKDLSNLLNFWDSYMDMAALNNNQYSELLNRYYEERYQAYKQLCDDEVAARAMAEYDKLKKARDAWSGFKAGTTQWAIENSNLAKQTADIVTNFYDGLADAMCDMVLTGKANWDELGKTVVKQLTMMVVKAMVLANLLKLMGMLGNSIGNWLGIGGGGGGGGIADLAANIAGTNFAAKGGIFAGGSITDFSSSVVNSPTMFNYDREMTQFASGGAVMGEAGWEGILPLGRNSRGELGVKTADQGTGGGGVNIMVNVINNSNEEVKTDTGMDSNGNKTIDILIGDVVAGQMQKPGSNLNKAVRSITGQKPQVVRR